MVNNKRKQFMISAMLEMATALILITLAAGFFAAIYPLK